MAEIVFSWQVSEIKINVLYLKKTMTILMKTTIIILN
jgi:hypothetical protein